jgi:hypothetical protein
MFRPLLLSPKALVIEKGAVASLLQLATTISPAGSWPDGKLEMMRRALGGFDVAGMIASCA